MSHDQDIAGWPSRLGLTDNRSVPFVSDLFDQAIKAVRNFVWTPVGTLAFSPLVGYIIDKTLSTYD